MCRSRTRPALALRGLTTAGDVRAPDIFGLGNHITIFLITTVLTHAHLAIGMHLPFLDLEIALMIIGRVVEITAILPTRARAVRCTPGSATATVETR